MIRREIDPRQFLAKYFDTVASASTVFGPFLMGASNHAFLCVAIMHCHCSCNISLIKVLEIVLDIFVKIASINLFMKICLRSLHYMLKIHFDFYLHNSAR